MIYYFTLSTHLTYYYFKGEFGADHWVKRGTALLMSLDH